MRLFLASLLICALPTVASAAGFSFEANVFYFSDSMVYTGTTTTFGRTLWDLAPGMGLDHKNQIVLGWNYGSMSFTDNPGTVTTLTVTDMGPKLTMYLDKDRNWPFAFTYNLISTGNYSSGGSTAQLRGTSMKAEFGYMAEMASGLLLGARINYYKASFNEQVINTTLTKMSNGRTAIYPTFSLVFRWE